MIQGVQTQQQADNAGGLVTLPSLLSLPENASPNCIDVEFGIGGAFGKRAGMTSTNSVALPNTAGWASFDFGSQAIRWHMVCAGTGVYASSNRGLTYVVVHTDRSQTYQYFERSKSLLIATSETHNRVLYWAGSVGTFMLGMPIGSAPAAKHALDFAGFLMLMNNSGGNQRVVYYADNNNITTDPWTTTFEVAGSQDDEITDATTYNTRAYIFTKYGTHQISHVGGNPDFAVRQIKDWGAVPKTVQRASYQEQGEVLIMLGWDRKVRVFDGTEELIISTPVEQNNTLAQTYFDNINEQHIEKCFSEVDTLKQLYKLWIVVRPSTEVTHCMNLNLRTGAWFPYRANTIQTATMAESANARIMLQVSQAGRVSMIDSGNTDNAQAVDELYDSRYFFGQTPQTVTKHHQLDFYFAPTSSGTLHIQDATNLDRTFGPVRERIVLDGTSGEPLVHRVMDLPTTKNIYQFRISSSASTANPWQCSRFDIVKDPKGIGGS